MRRIAFISGLILGGGITAYVLGSALIYLFTGKLSAIQREGSGPPRLALIDVDTLFEAPSVVPRTYDRWTGGES
jgi:hypothetical protein